MAFRSSRQFDVTSRGDHVIAVTGAIVHITGNSGAWGNRDREALKDFRIRWLSGGGRPKVALGPYSGAAIHDGTSAKRATTRISKITGSRSAVVREPRHAETRG